MDFYLANDDDDQSAEEKSVVNNVLKGYSKKEFLPVSTLEMEGPVRADINPYRFDIDILINLIAYVYIYKQIHVYKYGQIYRLHMYVHMEI
jgi:hypothetical protein